MPSERRRSAALPLAVVLGVGACDTQPGSTPGTATPAEPDSVAAEGDAVGEGEAEGEGASSGELPAEVAFAFVTLGKTWKQGGFAEMVDKPQPALLAQLWREDELPGELGPTLDRAFGTQEQRWALFDSEDYAPKLVSLDAGAAAERGFEAPAQQLWLVGPAGPCRARVGAPLLGWYSWGLEAVELSFALALDDPRPGCEAIEDAGSWSQVALLAPQMPTDLRYVPAELRAQGQVDLRAWSSPHAPRVAEAVATSEMGQGARVDEVWVREMVVPGTDFVELTVAMVDRYDPAPGEGPDPCMDGQENLVLVGAEGQAGLEPAPAQAAGWANDMAQLQGAYVRDGAVLWSVHESWGQPLILAGERVIELDVASFHPEDLGEAPYAQTEYCGP